MESLIFVLTKRNKNVQVSLVFDEDTSSSIIQRTEKKGWKMTKQKDTSKSRYPLNSKRTLWKGKNASRHYSLCRTLCHLDTFLSWTFLRWWLVIFFPVNHHFLVKLRTEYFIIQKLVLTYLKKFNVVLGALKIWNPILVPEIPRSHVDFRLVLWTLSTGFLL